MSLNSVSRNTIQLPISFSASEHNYLPKKGGNTLRSRNNYCVPYTLKLDTRHSLENQEQKGSGKQYNMHPLL
jgi:hypothetical protein